MTAPHAPVLLEEVLAVFEGREISCFIDGTLGAGGHAEAILKAHPNTAGNVTYILPAAPQSTWARWAAKTTLGAARN